MSKRLCIPAGYAVVGFLVTTITHMPCCKAGETVLHGFGGSSFSDGAIPVGKLLQVNNTLYGVTNQGGTHNYGTIYSVNLSTGAYAKLYEFGVNDAQGPADGLTAIGSTLYGTTLEGGTSGNGTVYKISTSGVETVLYSFGGGADGGGPKGSLVKVGNVLYGTTISGGDSTCNCGTIFRITQAGVKQTVYNFKGNAAGDGSYPYGAMLYLNGVIYGTTQHGGSGTQCYGNLGCGVIFSFTPSPQSGTEAVLWDTVNTSFTTPVTGGLTNVGNNLYGSLIGGNQFGAVFQLSTTGAFDVIYDVANYNLFGANPNALELQSSASGVSTFYTTARDDGGSNYGTIFSVDTNGAANVLYTFRGPSNNDGASPTYGLTNVNGVFYGTTNAGPTSNSYGTVFMFQ